MDREPSRRIAASALERAEKALKGWRSSVRSGHWDMLEVQLNSLDRNLRAAQKELAELKRCPGCRDPREQEHWDDCPRRRRKPESTQVPGGGET